MKVEELQEEEKNFQKNYVKAPSFLSIHLGVKASVLPAGTDCHHFVLEVSTRFMLLGIRVTVRQYHVNGTFDMSSLV